MWLLQLAKEASSHAFFNSPSALVSTSALAWSIASCLVPAVAYPDQYEKYRVSRLCRLASCGLLYLGLRGSSSNHVVLQGIVCATILEASTGGDFEARSTIGIRKVLGALYLVTCFAKCNSGFFHRETSCAMVYTVAGGATAGISRWPDFVLASTPYMAVAGELWLGVAFWSFEPSLAVVVGGALIHVGLALPRPPLSVYPFSMLMAPLFALASADKANLIPGFLVFPIVYQVFRGGEFFEYPAYGSWQVGVAWCAAAFAAVVFAAFKKIVSSPRNRRGAPISTFLVFFVGALPYLGVRTHPCFVMFSNLRLEYTSNHWFFGDRALRAVDLGAGRSSDIVQIRNASSFVLAMRVDLGQYISDADLLRSHGLSTEFVISPPRGHFAESHYRPQPNFYVPFHELLRIIHSRPDEDIFVNYSSPQSASTLLYYDRKDAVVETNHPRMTMPLSKADARIYRFRTLDLDKTPCRH